MKDKTFAENLKRERKSKGFTQESIAAELRISQKRYAKWEEGVWPHREFLVKLCEILEVDDLYLFLSKDVENILK